MISSKFTKKHLISIDNVLPNCMKKCMYRIQLTSVLCQLVDRGVAAIWSFYEGSVRLGKMTRVQMKNTMARLSPSIRYDDAKDPDIASIILFLVRLVLHMPCRNWWYCYQMAAAVLFGSFCNETVSMYHLTTLGIVTQTAKKASKKHERNCWPTHYSFVNIDFE